MIGGHGMGGACSHIKALGYPHSHMKGNSILKACWADMLVKNIVKVFPQIYAEYGIFVTLLSKYV
jgi:hypothetical protein